jgi:hypothetical protein
MMKLLVISVTYHMPQNRVCDTKYHKISQIVYFYLSVDGFLEGLKHAAGCYSTIIYGLDSDTTTSSTKVNWKDFEMLKKDDVLGCISRNLAMQ